MIFFQLLLFTVIVATALANECNACIDGFCYQNHLLNDEQCSIRTAAHADIDRTTDTIYYPLYINKEKRTISCALHLKDRAEVFNNDHVLQYSIDKEKRNVYQIQYSKGIRKYNPMLNSTEIIVPNIYIRRMYLKEKLYYTTYRNGLYIYDNYISQRVPALNNYSIINFLVDRDDNIFFRNDRVFLENADFDEDETKKVYMLNKITNEVHLLGHRSDDFTTDKDERVVFITEEVVATHLYKLENNIFSAFGVIDTIAKHLIFDSENNIVYRDVLNLFFNFGPPWYHLKKTNISCTFTSNATTTIIQFDDKEVIVDSGHFFFNKSLK